MSVRTYQEKITEHYGFARLDEDDNLLRYPAWTYETAEGAKNGIYRITQRCCTYGSCENLECDPDNFMVVKYTNIARTEIVDA